MKFYFSLRSPYSWLAVHDLHGNRPDVLRAADLRPFWEPDEAFRSELDSAGLAFPYTTMSRAKAFYILRDVARLARDRELAITWPIDRNPRWEVCHLPFQIACERGMGLPYVLAMGSARWLEGRDICDPATVAAVAKDLGLPAEECAGAADSPERRAAGMTQLEHVVKDGVFGVPYVIVGRDPYWGLDRLPRALAVVEARQAQTQEEAAVPGEQEPLRLDPAGHAGGCG